MYDNFYIYVKKKKDRTLAPSGSSSPDNSKGQLAKEYPQTQKQPCC